MVIYSRLIFRPFSFLLVLLISYNVYAAATLDPNFGTGGKVSFRIDGGSTDFGRAAVLQPDGKIVVIGSAQVAQQSNYSFAVMWYLDITP